MTFPIENEMLTEPLRLLPWYQNGDASELVRFGYFLGSVVRC